MENQKSCKLSEIEKMFPKWSHGTIYNRLKFLGIQGNSQYTHKEQTTGKVIYNYNAVKKLADLYFSEFPQNESEKLKFFNFKKDGESDFVKNDVKDVKATETTDTKSQVEEKNDILEDVDKVDAVKNVNTIKMSQNESIQYIPIELHNKIVEGLQKQIDILEKSNDRLSKQNDLLITQHESLIQNNETMAKVIGVKEQTALEENRDKREQRLIGTAEDNAKQSKWWKFWKK